MINDGCNSAILPAERATVSLRSLRYRFGGFPELSPVEMVFKQFSDNVALPGRFVA